jgi:hypothetical protein
VLNLKGFPLGFKADLFSLFANEVFEKTYLKFKRMILWFEGRFV